MTTPTPIKTYKLVKKHPQKAKTKVLSPKEIDLDAYNSHLNSDILKLQDLIRFYGFNNETIPQTKSDCLLFIKLRIFANIQDFLKGEPKKFQSRSELKAYTLKTHKLVSKEIAKKDLLSTSLMQKLEF
jgi:hypothetical protein